MEKKKKKKNCPVLCVCRIQRIGPLVFRRLRSSNRGCGSRGHESGLIGPKRFVGTSTKDVTKASAVQTSPFLHALLAFVES